MSDTQTAPRPKLNQLEWYKELAKYEHSDLGKSLGQIANTIVPYICLFGFMAWMIRQHVPYWYVLATSVLTAGLAIRIFIIFHDCGHGAFFKSHLANKVFGYFCGTLVFTPFEDWRHPHAIHHATTGDLDRRDVGEIWTMTVDEFMAAPRKTQVLYRLYRNPVGLFFFGPPVLFLIVQRFPHKGTGKRERKSVHVTNLLVLLMVSSACLMMGWQTYLMIQLPVIIFASIAGVWLFYVQHQFEPTYLVRRKKWDPVQAALAGSSYYHLPKLLQWFTGNIGLHHIHHLKPKIPNYFLQKCFDTIPEMRKVKPLTMRKSLTCMWLNLWDESGERLVSFHQVKRIQQLRA